jgi:hypothetical protein
MDDTISSYQDARYEMQLAGHETIPKSPKLFLRLKTALAQTKIFRLPAAERLSTPVGQNTRSETDHSVRTCNPPQRPTFVARLVPGERRLGELGDGKFCISSSLLEEPLIR